MLYLLVAQLAFDHGRVLSVTYPLLALALSCIGVLVAELTVGYARAVRIVCGPPGRRAC